MNIKRFEHQGFIIEVTTYETDNLNSFEVIGNFDISKRYNKLDGFIDKINDGYKLHIYMGTAKAIFIDKYKFNTFEECINWIKHHIDVLICH